MRPLLLILLLILSGFPAEAQTPVEKFKAICESNGPTYVTNICANNGEISRFALNMPRLCRDRGWGDQIAKAVAKCGVGNVYSDIWKFVYNNDRALEVSLVSFVKEGTDEGAVQGFEGVDRFGLFEIFYLACEKDSACHRHLFSIIPRDVQEYLVKTPLFCDYSENTDVSSFKDTDDPVLIDESSASGFRHPTCRKYYCLQKDCIGQGMETAQGELFILSKVWDSYYQRVYEGNLND